MADEHAPGRAGARHRGLDAARVLGRDRGGDLPPARRRRDGPDRRAGRRRRCGSAGSSTWSAPGTRAAASTPTCSSPTRGCCRSRPPVPRTSSAPASSPSSTFRRARAMRCVRTTGAARDEALYFDTMEERLVAGVARDQLPIYIDLSFLDGRRGAHVNISGISGVATKTTYASFLLYALFHGQRARQRGGQHQGADLQRQGRGPAVPRQAQRPALRSGPSRLRRARSPRRAV